MAKLPGMTRVLVNKPQPLEARFAEERDRVQAAFGSRLREYRVAKQLTLEMLAERFFRIDVIQAATPRPYWQE